MNEQKLRRLAAKATDPDEDVRAAVHVAERNAQANWIVPVAVVAGFFAPFIFGRVLPWSLLCAAGAVLVLRAVRSRGLNYLVVATDRRTLLTPCDHRGQPRGTPTTPCPPIVWNDNELPPSLVLLGDRMSVVGGLYDVALFRRHAARGPAEENPRDGQRR